MGSAMFLDLRRLLLAGVASSVVLLSACDEMGPSPIEPALQFQEAR
jgi:hypothetical protein